MTDLIFAPFTVDQVDALNDWQTRSGFHPFTCARCRERWGGVDQFALYLQHDGKDTTLQAYGEHVIPALTATGLAKQ